MPDDLDEYDEPGGSSIDYGYSSPTMHQPVIETPIVNLPAQTLRIGGNFHISAIGIDHPEFGVLEWKDIFSAVKYYAQEQQKIKLKSARQAEKSRFEKIVEDQNE